MLLLSLLYCPVLSCYLSCCPGQTWENDDQPLLDFAELAVLLSAISAAFVCELQLQFMFGLPQSAGGGR